MRTTITMSLADLAEHISCDDLVFTPDAVRDLIMSPKSEQMLIFGERWIYLDQTGIKAAYVWSISCDDELITFTVDARPGFAQMLEIGEFIVEPRVYYNLPSGDLLTSADIGDNQGVGNFLLSMNPNYHPVHRDERPLEGYDAFVADSAFHKDSIDEITGDELARKLLKLSYVGLGLAGEAGEFTDKLKKVVRDSNGKLTAEARLEMVKELGDVLWYVTDAAAELGYGLHDVLALNVEKLVDRRARGMQSGSGDNR